ncbi:MAG: hypothetical protein HYZ90_07155 [Candidatus Omnitrophica bacterium]|nr:hypothetical protein [Candidatus Omnitrophota bacterium]
MENRFRQLKVLGVVFKVVAWGAGIVGAVGAVGTLMSGGSPGTPRGVSAMILLVSALYFVIFYTVGEVIRLLLAIEERTRKS